MKPLSIVVTVVAVVLTAAIGWMLGPGAPWWLEHVDGVTGLQGEKLAAAVDAVRGRVLAVATGLAALLAVYYTARNADTARRTFQLGERGHDTDRYGKAAEQLGHDQAPVRLAGLYALEQLAQNNPSLRQTIVDVICAYLRMPFAPPDDDNREDSHSVVPGAARGVQAEQSGSITGRDPREERQVRLTAQRILAAHLRPSAAAKRRWQRGDASPSDGFWPGIRIDLTGATLMDFDFGQCRVDDARFSEATFTGIVKFSEATFTGDAWFEETTFTSYAWFNEITTTGRAYFTNATFSRNASFEAATFTQDILFDDITFAGQASFSEATFANFAVFCRTTFTGNAEFHAATFAGHAIFDDATFTGEASFHATNLVGEVTFDETTFVGRAWFVGTGFQHTRFRKASFCGPARFDQNRGAQQIDLERSVVTPQAMAAKHQWPSGWRVEPDGKGGGVLQRDSSHHTAEQKRDPQRSA